MLPPSAPDSPQLPPVALWHLLSPLIPLNASQYSSLLDLTDHCRNLTPNTGSQLVLNLTLMLNLIRHDRLRVPTAHPNLNRIPTPTLTYGMIRHDCSLVSS